MDVNQTQSQIMKSALAGVLQPSCVIAHGLY